MKDGSEEIMKVVSGGLVSFGFSNLILNLLDIFWPDRYELDLFIINFFDGFLIYVVISTIVGFFVVNSIKEKFIENSLKCGFFGFVFNGVVMFYMRVLYGLIWIFFGYILGGLTGGVLAELFKRK